ncbi:Uncharacterised protein [Mycobacteroides abscessus subsp. abscessus]|nr:Uncharacterised protein [Mycobacteroides abscessus subsp. abscessus]
MRVSGVRAGGDLVDRQPAHGHGNRENLGELEYELLRHHWEALVMGADARRHQVLNLPA